MVFSCAKEAPEETKIGGITAQWIPMGFCSELQVMCSLRNLAAKEKDGLNKLRFWGKARHLEGNDIPGFAVLKEPQVLGTEADYYVAEAQVILMRKLHYDYVVCTVGCLKIRVPPCFPFSIKETDLGAPMGPLFRDISIGSARLQSRLHMCRHSEMVAEMSQTLTQINLACN